MNISVERTDPHLGDTRPHFCAASGELVGIRFSSSEFVRELFCPWCGGFVPTREPGRDYPRAVRQRSYDGPQCAHGFPDRACVDLAQADDEVSYALMCGAIREYRAAELARRYGCAPGVVSWVRPCPECRRAAARGRTALLRHELSKLARALAEDLKVTERGLNALRDDARKLNEAFLELDTLASEPGDVAQRLGFVYLIGHSRALKIGWSERHPATPGGRLSNLQVASSDGLELIGLIEAPYSREREIQRLFSAQHLRGEWFRRDERILRYFSENGIMP